MNIVISGTSRGLGRLLAEFYLEQGHNVYGCARSASALLHENYNHTELDISDEAEVRNFVKDTVSNCSHIDLLINNAGLAQASLGIMTKASTAQDIMDVNLIGSFVLTSAVVKNMMRKKFGRVIFLSSINVPLRSRGSAIYNASKAGGEALMNTFASETSSLDITFNTIGLSMVESTGMSDSLSEAAKDDKKNYLRKPDLLTVGEVTHAIDFFANKNARNISGQTLYFGNP